jgi:hypothetical protein
LPTKRSNSRPVDAATRPLRAFYFLCSSCRCHVLVSIRTNESEGVLDRNPNARPIATPSPRGLSTRGDDQISGGTLGGFATGVGFDEDKPHRNEESPEEPSIDSCTAPNVSRDARASGLNRTQPCNDSDSSHIPGDYRLTSIDVSQRHYGWFPHRAHRRREGPDVQETPGWNPEN